MKELSELLIQLTELVKQLTELLEDIYKNYRKENRIFRCGTQFVKPF